MLAAVVHEVFVGLVDDDMEIVRERRLRDCLQIGAAQNDARRVVGIAQDENPGTGCHALAHRVDVERESDTAGEREADRRATGDPHHRLETEPARIGQEHFVAGVEQGEKGRGQSFHSARGHHDLRFRIGPQVVVAQELLRDGFTEVRQTPDVGVEGRARAAQHLDGRVLRTRRRVAPFPEVDDPNSLLAKLADPVHESKGGGYPDALQPGCPDRVVHLFVSLVRVRRARGRRTRDRLTPTQKRYLRAMAELGSGPHRSGDIAHMLNRKVTTVAPIRSSLIAKGMIYSPARGDTAFTVPLFDGFMKRTMPQP